MSVKPKPTLFLLLLLGSLVSSCGVGGKIVPSTIVATCSLDEIVGGTLTPPTNFSISLSTPDIVLRGWIGNALAGESPEEVAVVLADHLGKINSFKTGKTRSRPDVSTAYKKPGMENSGFEILMENVEKAGIYQVTLQGNFKGDAMICSRTYTLTVTE